MSREVALGLQLRVRSSPSPFSLRYLISLNQNKINKISLNGKPVLSLKAKPLSEEPAQGTAGLDSQPFYCQSSLPGGCSRAA